MAGGTAEAGPASERRRTEKGCLSVMDESVEENEEELHPRCSAEKRGLNYSYTCDRFVHDETSQHACLTEDKKFLVMWQRDLPGIRMVYQKESVAPTG